MTNSPCTAGEATLDGLHLRRLWTAFTLDGMKVDWSLLLEREYFFYLVLSRCGDVCLLCGSCCLVCGQPFKSPALPSCGNTPSVRACLLLPAEIKE